MAADKHQRFQQFGDRCPVAIQSPLPVVVQVGAAASDTPDRQHSSKHSSVPASSIGIQVASTSSEQLRYHRHQLANEESTRRASVVDENNNNSSPPRNPSTTTTTTATATAKLNHCHHEAATRTLLFHHHHRLHAADSSLTTTTTTTTDSLGTDSVSSSSDETAAVQSATPPPNYHEIPGIVPAYQGRSSGPPPSYDDVVNPNAPPPSYQSLFGQVREARKTSNGLVDLLRQLFLILIGTLGCTMIIGFLLLIPITMILVGIVYVNECKAENIPTFLVIGGIVWIMKNILNCYNQFKRDSTNSNRPPQRRAGPIASSTQAAGGDSPASVLIVGHHQQLSDSSNNQTSSHHSITTTATTTTTTIRTRREQEQSANRVSRTPSLIGITSFKCESMLNYFLIVWFFAGCIVVYRIYEPDYDNPLSQSYCHRTVYLYAFWLITSAFIIMAIVLSCLCCLMASSLMNCNQGR